VNEEVPRPYELGRAARESCPELENYADVSDRYGNSHFYQIHDDCGQLVIVLVHAVVSHPLIILVSCTVLLRFEQLFIERLGNGLSVPLIDEDQHGLLPREEQIEDVADDYYSECDPQSRRLPLVVDLIAHVVDDIRVKTTPKCVYREY